MATKGRLKSKHMVTILKIDGWKEDITAMMRKAGKIDEYTHMEPVYAPFGIIEKDGKHYLIDNEGCGSYDPLEDFKDSMEWYEHRKKDGDGCETFNMAPTAESKFFYKDLVERNLISKKRVRLDTFIRTGGIRLEGNYERTDRFLSGKIDKHGNWIKQELKTA